MTDSSAKLPNLWLLIAAAVSILLITIGVRMALELFVLFVVNSTELSTTRFSLIIAVFQLMWDISQPSSGVLADRSGASRVLAGGIVLLIAACLMVPQVPTYWGLMLGIGLLLASGTGSGGFSIIMGQVAAKTPPHRRGLASGLVNVGGSIGRLLFAPLVQGLIAPPHVGWTGTLYVWVVIAVLILSIFWWLTGGKHAVHTAHIDGGSQTLKRAVCKAFANRSYILLHLGFFTRGFYIAFLVTHLPTKISLCGLPTTIALASIVIIGLANIAGCIFSGWCTGRPPGKYILFGLYASRVVMILIYLAAPKTDLDFYLFAAGFGLTWLAAVAPTAAITGRSFGARYLATLFELTMSSHQIGGFLGSCIGDIVITRLNDYGRIWYADAVLAGATAPLNLLIHERKAAVV